VTYAPWWTTPTGPCDGYGPNNAFVDTSAIPCYVGTSCVEVPVVFSRGFTTPDVRLTHLEIQLSSELELCDTNPLNLGNNFLTVPVDGTWFYNGFGNRNVQVTDNGGGLYTVDQTLIGTPCGVTATGDRILFKVKVKASPSATAEDTGTISVTAFTVRGCANQFLPGIPGPAGVVTIDQTPPSAVSFTSATQVKSGNGIDGTTMITLVFTGSAATTEVYRAPFGVGDVVGAYPEYNDTPSAAAPVPGSYPPGAPWVQTTVTGSGQTDEPPNRGFWYYVAYTKDACGNVSAVSNMTGGTLNYHLGDVAPPPGGGNNIVDGLDISDLGAHYGGVYNPTYNYLDVGPTTDYSVDARPTTDNVINFEDLIMFAINFGTVGFQGEMPTLVSLGNPGSGPVRLDAGPITSQVRAGQMVDVPVVLRGAGAHVQGIKTVVGYDPAILSYQSSEVSGTIGSTEHFFKDLPSTGQVELGLALLGHGASMEGEGPVAILHFRVLRNGPAMVRLTGSSVRDTGNRELLGQAVVRMTRPTEEAVTLPTQYVLGDARPNPFNPKTVISYDLPQTSQVQLVIYDVAGRVVRTLVDGQRPAGSHGAEWDGRDDGGRPVGSGIYFYAMRAGAWQSQKRLTLLK
jgi:hypothetical protein